MMEILKAALKDNKIISFCIGKVDWDKRIIGYVKSITKNRITIDAVDIFGSVVKNKSVAVNKITVVEIDDSYNKHLEKLKNRGKSIKKTNSLFYYNKGKSFKEKVELLRRKGSICTFYFGTEYMTGVIKEIKENILYINCIGYRGTKEGKSYCKLKEVTKIRYQGALEAKISYLLKVK